MNDIIKTHNELELKTRKKIDMYVKLTLGDRFGVRVDISAWSCICEIGLMKSETEFKFGHTFTITYRHKRNYKEESTLFNYGTLGSFDVMDDKDRCEYMMAMAKAANNKKFLDMIKLEFRKAMYVEKLMEKANEE